MIKKYICYTILIKYLIITKFVKKNAKIFIIQILHKHILLLFFFTLFMDFFFRNKKYTFYRVFSFIVCSQTCKISKLNILTLH